jgi:hypothetical protein
MRLIKNLMLSVILGISMSIIAYAETKEESIALTELPPVVKESIMNIAPEAKLKSVKKITENSTRYQINYKAKEGTQHQITLDEEGKPMVRRKDESEAK